MRSSPAPTITAFLPVPQPPAMSAVAGAAAATTPVLPAGRLLGGDIVVLLPAAVFRLEGGAILQTGCRRAAVAPRVLPWAAIPSTRRAMINPTLT